MYWGESYIYERDFKVELIVSTEKAKQKKKEYINTPQNNIEK